MSGLPEVIGAVITCTRSIDGPPLDSWAAMTWRQLLSEDRPALSYVNPIAAVKSSSSASSLERRANVMFYSVIDRQIVSIYVCVCIGVCVYFIRIYVCTYAIIVYLPMYEYVTSLLAYRRTVDDHYIFFLSVPQPKMYFFFLFNNLNTCSFVSV